MSSNESDILVNGEVVNAGNFKSRAKMNNNSTKRQTNQLSGVPMINANSQGQNTITISLSLTTTPNLAPCLTVTLNLATPLSYT